MDRILKIQKKENDPRASSAPALELNTMIFIHVYWYMQQISGERLQDHWSSGFYNELRMFAANIWHFGTTGFSFVEYLVNGCRYFPNILFKK